MDQAKATSELLAARYGSLCDVAAAASSPVLALLLAHRSIRRYRPDPVPPALLETLIAAAQSAATSSNLQSFSVVAVTDPERKARLAEWSNRQGFIREAPLFLAWIADLSRLARLGERQGKTLAGLDYLETFIVAAIDAALAAQNFAVAAQAVGLGICYIGALRSRPEEVARELALPPRAVALFGMTVGYPAEDDASEVKPRLPQPLVLHREQYAPRREEEAIADYDSALAAFSERQGLGPTAWTPRVLARVGSAEALGGRDRMAEALRQLGFPLK
ncbi:MAG: nitroreductase family protein [Rhodovarius sp.]|nr:nitroreductase family protein [Rhodovarius sp.]